MTVNEMKRAIKIIEENSTIPIDVIFTADGREIRTVDELKNYFKEVKWQKAKNLKWRCMII